MTVRSRLSSKSLNGLSEAFAGVSTLSGGLACELSCAKAPAKCTAMMEMTAPMGTAQNMPVKDRN